jgi:hypothetical protein
VVIEEREYDPFMLHGWALIQPEMRPDHLLVDHLPWVFRDVASHNPRRQPSLNQACVYVRQVQDELFLTIEHIGIHWLEEREKDWMDTRYPFHEFQRVDCLNDGPGTRRYVACRASGDFTMPSVLLDIHDGTASSPICEEGPRRFRLAQRAGLPYVLSFVTEQHFEDGEYLSGRDVRYIAPLDPQNVLVKHPPKDRQMEEMMKDYCDGKRWDRILERAYLRDSSHAITYPVDISRLPVFFRESNYMDRSKDEDYTLVSGSGVILLALAEGLEMVLALFRDTLRIDSASLDFMNRLHNLTRDRRSRFWDKRNKLRGERYELSKSPEVKQDMSRLTLHPNVIRDYGLMRDE